MAGSIRKAVIPAAGFGTRFLPITKAIPKEMLPIGDKPIIHYVVEEAVEAGLTEILLVISKGKEALIDYFTRNPELERRLRATGRADLARQLNALSDMARIHYVYQHEMKGLGDAVLQGRSFAGLDSFAVLLGDTVVTASPDSMLSPMRRLIEASLRAQTSVVAIEPIPAERVGRYGVAGGEEIAPGLFRLSDVVEKPTPAEAPRIRRNDSHDAGQSQGDEVSTPYHAFAARYVFTPTIFEHLANTAPGKNGEIQLTDAMRTLLGEEGLHAIELQGVRHDVGDPEGLLKAARIIYNLRAFCD